MNESEHTFCRPSICLNEFLSHCLLLSVDFCDQFFTYFMQNITSKEKL